MTPSTLLPSAAASAPHASPASAPENGLHRGRGRAGAPGQTGQHPVTGAARKALAGKDGAVPKDAGAESAPEFALALAGRLKDQQAPAADGPATEASARRSSRKAAEPQEALPAADAASSLNLAALGLQPSQAEARPATGAHQAPVDALASPDAAALQASPAQATADAASVATALPAAPEASPNEALASNAAGHPGLDVPEASRNAFPSTARRTPGQAAAGTDLRQSSRADERLARALQGKGDSLEAMGHQAWLQDRLAAASEASQAPEQQSASQAPEQQSASQAYLASAQALEAPVESFLAGSVIDTSAMASGFMPATSTTNSPASAPAQAVASYTAQLPQAPGSAAWQQALGQQVVFMTQAGLDSAELQLNPLELGPLKVSLSLSDGTLSASFRADQPAIREAVEAALPQLRTALAEQGLQLGQAGVDAGTSQASHSSPSSQDQKARPGATGERRALGSDAQAAPALRTALQAPRPAGPGRLHTWA